MDHFKRSQSSSLNFKGFSLTPYTICLPGLEYFSEWLEESGLFDLAYRVYHLTWTNKSPTNPKARKLDRALTNEAWLEKYPDWGAYFDAPCSFDHSPCLITLDNGPSVRETRFLYYNMFATHPGSSSVRRGMSFYSCLWFSDGIFISASTAAKCFCRSLNRSNFSDIQRRSNEAFKYLESVQRHVLSAPTVDMFDEKHNVRNSWMFFAAAEESFMHQKSRVKWLNLEDLSTWIFFKSVKVNLQKNKIMFLLDYANVRVYESTIIKEIVTQFYEHSDVVPMPAQKSSSSTLFGVTIS